MTAKDKATELLNKFFLTLTAGGEIGFATKRKHVAKTHALIAVDEIIEAIDWHEVEIPNEQFVYWQEVKKELELL